MSTRRRTTIGRMGLGLLVGALLLTGAAAPVDRAARAQAAAAARAQAAARVPLSAELRRAIVEATAEGRSSLTVMIVPEAGKSRSLASAVQRLGGKLLTATSGGDYLAVSVPVERLAQVASLTGVRALSPDARVSLDEAPSPNDGVRAAGTAADQTAAGVRQSLADNNEAMKTPEFRDLTGADGRGVTIAIIDTGIDPSHPDLAMTSDWQPKIVDWQDFTGEGDVKTSGYATATRGIIITPFGSLNVGRIVSKSGRYHYGLFHESDLNRNGEIGQDVNRNGVTTDDFPVLVVDSTKAGFYDTVYVDTDGDYSFADEVPLQPFVQSRSFTYFGSDPNAGGLAFVVTAIRHDGGLVNLGFDGNGHGTHVAGIAAAAGLYRNGAVGVAPGARLMALKVLDSAGDGSWDSISRALAYAAEHGAKVVCLSLATVNDNSSADSAQSQLITELSLKYDLLVAIAAGNEGPGVASALTPGDANEALTVGAYFSPAMWKHLYGLDVPHEGIWYYSAVGPRRDGSLATNVVAPGAAVSTAPMWLSTGAYPPGYQLREGTSMAAPCAAGAAALLMQAAADASLSITARQVKSAIELGARKLGGYEVIEQGHGLIDLPAAWSHLQQMIEDSPKILAWVGETVPSPPGGIYARDFDPAGIGVTLENPGATTVRLDLASDSDWVDADHRRMTIPAQSQRQIYLRYRTPDRPGLYSSLLFGVGQASRADDLQFLSTVIHPYRFDGGSDWKLRINGTVEAAHYQRYFFAVPNGATELRLKLSIPADQRQGYLGRAWMQVNRPDGGELTRTDYIGLGSAQDIDRTASGTPLPGTMSTPTAPPGSPSGPGAGSSGASTEPAAVERVIANPETGVWEVVVYSSPVLSSLGRDTTVFSIDAELRGFEVNPDSWRANVEPGTDGQVAQEFQITDHGVAGDVSFVAYGLSRAYSEVVTERAYIREHQVYSKTLPEVPPGTALLRVSVGNPSSPDADLDLYLYRYDQDKKDWVEFGHSAEPGVSNEVVEVAAPPPGQYVAYVEAYGNASESSFELQVAQVPDAGQMSSSDVGVTHSAGDSWTATVRAVVPQSAGEYYGYLALRDVKSRRTLALLPVFFSQGRPVLTLDALDRRITTDRPGEVNLRLRDPNGGEPVTGLAVVNGRSYEAVNGRLSIPVDAAADGLSLQVVAGADEYGYAEYSLLFVPAAPGSDPADLVQPALPPVQGSEGGGASQNGLDRLLEDMRSGTSGH